MVRQIKLNGETTLNSMTMIVGLQYIRFSIKTVLSAIFDLAPINQSTEYLSNYVERKCFLEFTCLQIESLSLLKDEIVMPVTLFFYL